MQVLKADTEVKVRMGPFVDVGDGFTPETAVTLAGGGDNADEAELLKHNGAATVDISGNGWAAIAGCDGWYDLTVTAGNTDTEGILDIIIQNDSVHLPVHKSFMVMNDNSYEAFYENSSELLTVDLTQILTNSVAGNAATLTLKQLDIQNNAASALVCKSTGGNGHGMDIAGNGTGEGVSATGGATGHGIGAIGGSTSGDGINATAGNDGDGIQAAGATNGHGINADGVGTGEGISAVGGADGHGIHAQGGGTTGNGIFAEAATEGHGIYAKAIGTNEHGIYALGGDTSGDGIHSEAATEGDGIYALAKGTDEHGILAVGGDTSGDGLHAEAATEGDGIYALAKGTDEHGICAVGGDTSGDGINATAANDGDGIEATAAGNNSGMKLTGSGTDHGLEVIAGGTGDGVNVSATNGDGIASAGATNGKGMSLTGAGTGEGFASVGAAVGKGGVINVALDTTLAVRTDDTIFTLNGGSAANDAYNNMVLALYDVSGSLIESRKISDYVGASKTITVDTAFTFTVAANDIVRIFQSSYAPTVAAGGGATAAQVWAHDVSAFSTSGQAGTYQKDSAGSHLHR